jgi:hypothetical protein
MKLLFTHFTCSHPPSNVNFSSKYFQFPKMTDFDHEYTASMAEGLVAKVRVKLGYTDLTSVEIK